MSTGLRIIKLGGSLLDFEGLVPALHRWIASQSPCTNVVITGGGRLANFLRDFDRRHNLDPETAHWLAVRALRVTAHVAAKSFDRTPPLYDLHEMKQLESQGELFIILDVYRFMTQTEPNSPGTPLPRDWSVTSDSIAARFAEVTGAEQLVLLKSALPPADCDDWLAAARQGFVDAYFPTAAARLSRACCVNLRHPDAPRWCARRDAARLAKD